VTLAAEIQMDELAEKAGIDAVEFRLRNFAAPSERFFPKKRGMTADLRGDVQKLAQALDWGGPLAANRGRGVAIVALDAGAVPVNRSELRVHGDGSLTVFSGSTEMGQGSRTVMAQIAAEEFGTLLDRVRVVQSDTAATPFSYSTGAERTTGLEGRALYLACQDAKEQLRQMAAELWEADPADIQLDSFGAVSEGRHLAWSEIIGQYFDIQDMEVTGRGHVRQADELAELPPFWVPSIAGVEVEVNPESGQVKLTRLASVSDVGLAINPAMVEGQDLGSAIQGYGVALAEELVYEGQQLTNGSLLDYRVPRFSDVPSNFASLVVENRDGVGPYGAKGMGEGPTSSMCAAVSNAIYQAVGVRLHRAPFTPERVWRAMRERDAERSSSGDAR
jgi:CO/xanthine dehydrogenase Mo-binding subunit